MDKDKATLRRSKEEVIIIQRIDIQTGASIPIRAFHDGAKCAEWMMKYGMTDKHYNYMIHIVYYGDE